MHWVVFIDGATTNNHILDQQKRASGFGIYVCEDKDLDPHTTHPFYDDVNKTLKVGEKIMWRAESMNSFPRTNNRSELMAAIRFLELWEEGHFDIKSTDTVEVVGDSAYVCGMINNWMKKWRKNDYIKKDGKVPENIDLVKKLDVLLQKKQFENIIWRRVNSHKKEPKKDESWKSWYDWHGNKEADKLARAGCGKFEKKIMENKEVTGEKRKS